MYRNYVNTTGGEFTWIQQFADGNALQVPNLFKNIYSGVVVS